MLASRHKTVPSLWPAGQRSTHQASPTAVFTNEEYLLKLVASNHLIYRSLLHWHNTTLSPPTHHPSLILQQSVQDAFLRRLQISSMPGSSTQQTSTCHPKTSIMIAMSPCRHITNASLQLHRRLDPAHLPLVCMRSASLNRSS
jgi:hypothetical protein